MGLLPATKNVPVLEFDRQTKIIHGVTGVGKTSMFDAVEGAAFISTRGRCDHVTSIKGEVANWKEFETVCKELETRTDIKVVVVDDVSSLWPFAADAYCASKGIKTLLDEKWGPGYAVCETMIWRTLVQLRKKYPLVFIAHSVYDDTPEDGPNGTPVVKVKWIPDCYKRVHTLIKNMSYFEGYMEMMKGERVIHCNPSDKWEASAKLPLGSAKLPDTILLPDGANSYAILKGEYEKALASRSKV
jgi:hypothetical protein